MERLAEFHQIWDVLSPENRGRLLRAVIGRVEVDEPANQITVFVFDLAAGVPQADEEPRLGMTSELAHDRAAP